MVKLLRTDTTLDLSQKARVVRISRGCGAVYIASADLRTDQVRDASGDAQKCGDSDTAMHGMLVMLSRHPHHIQELRDCDTTSSIVDWSC